MRPIHPLLLLTATAALAQDWPEFRGPDKQGNSATIGLPTEWNPNLNKNIVWKAALPGVGWSSPVVIGDRIYVTSAVPVGGEEKPVIDRSFPLDGLADAFRHQESGTHFGKICLEF
jgi:hypothetical protein